MELRHLRYFVSVAEAASVSKAARRVNICQPALSRQIRDLEAELGVRLFDRIGRRIQLTAGGEDLLGRSRDVLAHAEALIEHARSLAGRSAGILRVGATPQTLQSVLAAFLLKFQRARPGVDIRLTEDGGVRLYELVERGEIHLALSGILTGRPLESRPLFPIRVLAVAAIRQNRPLAAADRRPNGLTHWKLQPSVRTSGPMAERSVFTMSTDTRGGNRGTWSRFEPLARNGRYPLRQIRRNPGFSAIAIVTLALGIGANTAMFSAVDAVLIRSLLYADAGRLVVVWTNSLRTGESKFYLTPPEWYEWRGGEQCEQRCTNKRARRSGGYFLKTNLLISLISCKKIAGGSRPGASGSSKFPKMAGLAPESAVIEDHLTRNVRMSRRSDGEIHS